MIADAAGNGVVAWGDIKPDCIKGGCGRYQYRRKGIDVQLVGQPDCRQPNDYCELVKDEEAPTASGYHEVEWSFCTQLDCYSTGSGSIYSCPDITDESTPEVTILDVSTSLGVPYASQCGITDDEKCWSRIVVAYTYSDSFEYPRYYEGADDCDEHVGTHSVSVGWYCVYAKRVAAGQMYAQGNYPLIYCEYPAAVPTLEQNGPCALIGGTVCSTNPLTPVQPPTLWKPPSYVALSRLA